MRLGLSSRLLKLEANATRRITRLPSIYFRIYGTSASEITGIVRNASNDRRGRLPHVLFAAYSDECRAALRAAEDAAGAESRAALQKRQNLPSEAVAVTATPAPVDVWQAAIDAQAGTNWG